MNKRVALNGLAALALLGAAVAHAETQPGFYAGAAIGQANIEIDAAAFDGDDTSFKVFGGYNFNDHFAVEASYLDGGAPDQTYRVGNATGKVEADITAFAVAGVGRLPLNEQFALFGKLGFTSYDVEVTGRAGNSSFRVDGSDEDVLYGVGAAFSFSPSFELRAEYEAIAVSNGDFNIISVGALFKF